VTLLGDVEEATKAVRAAEANLRAARRELRQAIKRAADEGISFARIGRAAGVSGERARQLYETSD
jgi:Tfp pilus assembly protein PilX